MANRYWVGGTGTWNSSSTTHWSTTSGGSSGASAPTSSDDVFINSSSGGGTITLSSAVCRDLTTIGFTGTLGTVSSNLTISRNLVMGSTVAGHVTANCTFDGTHMITSNGATWTGGWVFNTSGSTFTLLDDAHITGLLGLTLGTINLGSFTLQCSRFIGNASNTYVLNLGTGTLQINNNLGVSQGSAFSALSSNFTITGTGSIKFYQPAPDVNSDIMTIETPVDFTCPLIFPNRSTVRIEGSPTFSGALDFQTSGSRFILVDDVIFGPDLEFVNILTDGTWSLLISDPPGNQNIITQISGTRVLENIAIQDISFTGGASFIGENCIDLGNVAGIEITQPTNIPEVPRGEDYFLYAETTGPTTDNPFGTSSED